MTWPGPGEAPRPLKATPKTKLDINRFTIYVELIRFFEARAGGFDAGMVLPEDVLAYRRALLERLKPATANRRLSAVKAFFKWLYGRGQIPSDPAREVPGLNDGRLLKAPRALSGPDLRRLLSEACRARNPLHRAVVVCC